MFSPSMPADKTFILEKIPGECESVDGSLSSVTPPVVGTEIPSFKAL